MPIPRPIVLLVLLLPSSGAQTHAQTVLTLREGVNGYSGTADATLYEEFEDHSNGGHAYLYSGTILRDFRNRSLLRFDLSGLPPAVRVESAELELTIEGGQGFVTNYTLHRMTSDWGEGETDSGTPGGQGTVAAEGDATWRSNFHNQSSWTSPGGDFTATPSADEDLEVDGNARFSSAGLADDVNLWLEQPETNFGWILIGDEDEIKSARRFFSSEAPGQSTRPLLRLTLAEKAAADASWTLYN
jgi:hypothetical protein